MCYAGSHAGRFCLAVPVPFLLCAVICGRAKAVPNYDGVAIFPPNYQHEVDADPKCYETVVIKYRTRGGPPNYGWQGGEVPSLTGQTWTETNAEGHITMTAGNVYQLWYDEYPPDYQDSDYLLQYWCVNIAKIQWGSSNGWADAIDPIPTMIGTEIELLAIPNPPDAPGWPDGYPAWAGAYNRSWQGPAHDHIWYSNRARIRSTLGAFQPV